MAALSLKAAPTFWHRVLIPVTGAEPAPIDVEYRHRTRTDLKAYIDALAAGEKADTDLVADVVVSWKGPDQAFNPEAVALLCDNFPLAALAIWQGYLDAYAEAKRKN
jgi:hypothetical protein